MPEPGDVVAGKYRIVALLGQGGLGRVFRVRQFGLDREVALKVLRDEFASDAESVRRFHREVEAMAALAHPNIIRVLDFGQDAGECLYFTMDLLAGEPLSNFIGGRRQLDLDTVVSLLAQSAEALAHVHARRLVHRDVKPANMMMDQTGRLTLMDFGLVRIPGRTILTVAGERLGTPRYMAPEAILESRMDGPAMDVYGLGVSFWELLTGRRLHGGLSLQQFLEALSQGKLESPTLGHTGIPDWLCLLLERSLSEDPTGRPTAAQIATECRSEGSAEPVQSPLTDDRPTGQAGRRGAPPRPAPQATIGPAFVITGIALILVLAIAATLGVVLTRHRPAPSPPIVPIRPVPPPAMKLSTVSFPSHRGVAVEIEGAIPQDVRFEMVDGSPPVAKGSSEPIAKGLIDRDRARVVFERLPQNRPVRVVARDVGGIAVGTPLDLVLPSVRPLREFRLVPSDTAALVDFDVPAGSQVRVQLSREDSSGSWVVAADRAQGTVFRRLFGGLRPATRYRLRLSVDDGWIAFPDWPFETLEAGRRSLRDAWISTLDPARSRTSGIVVGVPSKDPLLEAPVRDCCRRDPVQTRAEFDTFVEIAGDLASRELADLLLPHLPAGPEERAFALGALGSTRHPRAASLALSGLDQPLSSRGFVWLAQTAARARTPEACDRVGRALARVGAWQCNPGVLVDCHRSTARALFRDWLRAGTESNPQRASLALRGLALLGEPSDRETMLALLASARSQSEASPVVRALPVLDPRTATPAIDAAIARLGPGIEPFLALARCESGTPPRSLADPRLATADATTLRAAVFASGETHGESPVLSRAIDHPDPWVATTAAWAAARVKRESAGPAIARLVDCDRDPGGLAALALAEMRNRASLDIVTRALLRTLAPRAPDPSLLVARFLALTWLSGGPIGEEVSDALLHATLPSPIRPLLDTISRMASAPDRSVFLVPASVPFVRTTVHLLPGDWIEVASLGAWAFDGPPAPCSSPSEHLASRSGGPGLQLSVWVRGRVWMPTKQGERFVSPQEGDVFLGARILGNTGPGSPRVDPPRGVALVTIRSSVLPSASPR